MTWCAAFACWRGRKQTLIKRNCTSCCTRAPCSPSLKARYSKHLYPGSSNWNNSPILPITPMCKSWRHYVGTCKERTALINTWKSSSPICSRGSWILEIYAVSKQFMKAYRITVTKTWGACKLYMIIIRSWFIKRLSKASINLKAKPWKCWCRFTKDYCYSIHKWKATLFSQACHKFTNKINKHSSVICKYCPISFPSIL